MRLVDEIVHRHAAIGAIPGGQLFPQPHGQVLVDEAAFGIAALPQVQGRHVVVDVAVSALPAGGRVQVENDVHLLGRAPPQYLVNQANAVQLLAAGEQLVVVIPSAEGLHVGIELPRVLQGPGTGAALGCRQEQVVVKRQPHAVETLCGNKVNVGLGDEAGSVLLVELLHLRLRHGAQQPTFDLPLRAERIGFDDVAFLQQPATHVAAPQQNGLALGIHNFRTLRAQHRQLLRR